ncbi:GNAT family N-acetyltransferase [Actinokineospora iranica]|uniref:Protein N-acetyltransferase, RimJ/RimL family n=1 Tax=Actinokineospora iranica TaxID=1271860 RepID=A0A1G6JPU3_9PSEU|nr:GNAT family protein [Actinokineospora iranica]SDC20681.1 Protein N-acetyltransferase, RimJ/RimL family [Actinokineospora iranica]
MVKISDATPDTSADREPTLWLRGEKAALGPFLRDLVPLYWRWETDPRSLLGFGQQYAETVQTRAGVFDAQSRDGSPYFTIYDTTGSEPIPVGMSQLIVDNRTRTGEFIILIGEEGRGKGIGTEATRLTLDYGFHVTALRNVYLSVVASNFAGIRAYEKAGFKVIGRRRNSGHWFGEIVDHVLMDAIPADFPGPSVVKNIVG